jgi:molybdopterin-guanine dinucleotide biosynthesis protein A
MERSVIILAGGKSIRMGANKALVPFKGKPMIMQAIAIAEHYSWPVLISANNADLDHLGFPVVHDILQVPSPLAGIHGGLAASRTAWNLVLSCDMPHIDSRIIDRLRSHLTDEVRMVVPVHDNLVEPLCGFYHRDLIPVIEANASLGKMSPLDLLKESFAVKVTTDDFGTAVNAFLFKNVNEKRDLEGLE